jgi:hypothetical protein
MVRHRLQERPNVVELMVEVVEGINSGAIRTTQPLGTSTLTPTKVETFVREEFLPLYNGSR